MADFLASYGSRASVMASRFSFVAFVAMSIVTPMSRTEDIDDDSVVARRARQKRKAADRSRSYRARLRAARCPEARDIDAALSEALAFHVAKGGAIGVNIELLPLMKTARLVLEREGYAPVPSAAAIADRLSHREEHLDPHHIPSLRPGPVERMRPTKSGPWQTPMPAIVAHLVGV